MNYKILTIFLAAALTVGILPAYAGPVIIDGTDSPDHGSGNGVSNFGNWAYIENAIKSLLEQETRAGPFTVDVLMELYLALLTQEFFISQVQVLVTTLGLTE